MIGRGAMIASLRAISVWWYSIATVIAIAAFLAPLLTAPSDENPTGGAGLFAPVVALCTAAIVLAEAVNAKRFQFRRIPSMFIGIGSMATAYLWMAAEADVHPANPTLLGAISLLWIVAALATVAMPLIALVLSQRSRDSTLSPGTEHRIAASTDSFIEHVAKPLLLLLAVLAIVFAYSHSFGDKAYANVLLPAIVAVALVLITQTTSWQWSQERKKYEERIANLLAEIRDELKNADKDGQ